MEDDIFYILNLYYRVLLPHVTGRDIPKNLREILHDKLIQTLNTLPQQRIILLNMSVLDGATSRHENLQRELSSYKEEALRLSNALKDHTEKFNLSSFSKDFNALSKKERFSKIFWLLFAFLFTRGTPILCLPH